jgi:hypothetical protein
LVVTGFSYGEDPIHGGRACFKLAVSGRPNAEEAACQMLAMP